MNFSILQPASEKLRSDRSAPLKSISNSGLRLGIARRIDLFDQFVKGQLLIAVAIQTNFAHLAQQTNEARIVAKIESQRQNVDEEADDTFHLRAVAPSHGGADDDIGLTADPRQQHVERRE